MNSNLTLQWAVAINICDEVHPTHNLQQSGYLCIFPFLNPFRVPRERTISIPTQKTTEQYFFVLCVHRRVRVGYTLFKHYPFIHAAIV